MSRSAGAGRDRPAKVAAAAAVVALFAAGALFFVSCRAPEGAKSAAEEIPRVDDAVVMPALSRGGAELLVAFRHTRCGFLEEKGFDTYVYRFRLLPSGRIDSAAKYERKPGGENRIASWNFARAGDAVIATEMRAGGESIVHTLEFSGDRADIGGAARRSVTMGKDSLRIGSAGGEYQEEYATG